MDTSDHIANLAENAIETCIIRQLDILKLLRQNNEIKWENLGIENESDFRKGFLLSEIMHEVANNFFKTEGRFLNPPGVIETYKIIMGRAEDIKKATAERFGPGIIIVSFSCC